jgi:uracil-DNA glycosylase
VEELLRDLARVRFGDAFPLYVDGGALDVDGAAALRLANLRRYLDERRGAEVLAVGEAGGYQGMRWSGIAFTSERDLARWGDPYRPTCRARPGGWSEPSGTLVHRTLEELGAERRVVLWNTVPAHPHHPGRPLSNRRPRAAEIAAGAVFLERVRELLRPRLVLAVGRVAEEVLGDGAVYVRHPSMGGATAFRAALAQLLAGRARAPI